MPSGLPSMRSRQSWLSSNVIESQFIFSALYSSCSSWYGRTIRSAPHTHTHMHTYIYTSIHIVHKGRDSTLKMVKLKNCCSFSLAKLMQNCSKLFTCAGARRFESEAGPEARVRRGARESAFVRS